MTSDRDADRRRPTPEEAVELIADRERVLGALTGGPQRVNDLVDALDVSRSTAHRALRELREAGLVEGVEEGYAATLAGRLLVRRYRRFRDEETASVLDAAPVLARLSADSEFGLDVVAGCEAATATKPTPYRPVERIRTAVGGADSHQAMLPVLGVAQHLRLCYELVVTRGGTSELLVPRELFEELRADFPRRLSAMAGTGRFRLSTGPVPEYGVVLVGRERREWTTALVVAFGDAGSVSGVIENDADRAVDWATARIDAAAAAATDVTDRIRPGASEGDGADEGRADGG